MNFRDNPDLAGFSADWLARTCLDGSGEVVTFYSYKGGTGRSMGLVNCAGLLSQALPDGAKPILLVDFDLEAPGLHRYLGPLLPHGDSWTDRPGVLELFECLRSAVDKRLSETPPATLPNPSRLDDETVAELVNEFDLAPYVIETSARSLSFIKSGRFDDSYGQRLSRFVWEEVFSKAPALFRCIADRLAHQYSFTFVDSRTGLSDTSSICTMLLPDALVMVFTPNSQSLTGIEHLVRKAVAYRAGASDARQLRIYPLPSRVDNQVEHFRQVWRLGATQHPLFGTVTGFEHIFRDIFASALGMIPTGDDTASLTEYFNEVQIPHSADYAYGERLCFTGLSSSDSLSIRNSYEKFLPWLVTGAQPWQRPADLLANQQAKLWLQESGATEAPLHAQDSPAWFERVWSVLGNSQHPVLLKYGQLSHEHKANIGFALAVAHAYRDDLDSSIEWLKKATEACGEEIPQTVDDSAAGRILEFWSREVAPVELSLAKRRAWIEEIDRLMAQWQAPRGRQVAWLSSVADFAVKAAWFDVAQKEFEKLVRVHREALGEEHPDTLTSMNDLAEALRAQERLAEAREIHEKVLAIRRRVLGEEDLDTLKSIGNLVTTLCDQGDLAGALVLQEQVLAVHRRTLGENHPSTMASMNNLMKIVQAQGDPDAIASARMESSRSSAAETLDLSHVGLIELSPSIGELTHLRVLNLRGNSLRALPDALWQLGQLQSLDISDNQLATLPDAVRQLGRLRYFDFSKNQGATLAPVATLTNLQTLIAVGTQVADLAPLSHLTNLQTLHVSGTQVADLAPLSRLTNLQTLHVSGTQVADLAPLSDLINLQTLDVSHTQVSDLSTLDSLIGQGRPVTWSSQSWQGPGIYVEGCPLINPPPEIAKQGNDAILNYFRARELGGVDHMYEAKMVILGEGGAGKTSLLRRLYQPDQPLPTEQESTKGISIYRHEFPLKNGRNFRLNVWDFGGQEIYHATHQFFLTRRSLYLLVDDTRKDHKSVSDEGFQYWLELVDLFGGHSPVLIFQNEKGGRRKAIDLAGIKARYGNVKDCYAGNLEYLSAADGLRAGIEFYASNLSHIGEELPVRWIQVRADIEERAGKMPHITQQEYFDIYSRHLPFDRSKALLLSRYLHDLGVFLHFQDDPLLARTVILQNTWASEAVFRILDDEMVEAQSGRFNKVDCKRLWRDSVYADMHPELLALMQRFELCYALADSQPQSWLAPQLLPTTKPIELSEWGKPKDLVLRYHYDFMPKGIISRLTVRLHRFVRKPKMAWTTGVLFERDATEVLVELLGTGSNIELRARGPERKALLSVITAELDALNESFQGLADKVDKRIPCNCKHCRTAPAPHFFAQKILLKRKEDNRLKVECPSSYEDVDVLELLDGIRVDKLPVWAKEEKPIAHRRIRILLASSSELREDRDAFDLYFRQQNDQLIKEGLELEIVRWENFLDALSETRLQDEYNKALRACDIFVSLFFTKTGKFTEEEFETALRLFKDTGRPRIYTFFKNADIKTGSALKEDLKSLWAFQKKLGKLGHFYTSYDNIEHLKRQFRDQLDKLLR